jgi:hypothetical protein
MSGDVVPFTPQFKKIVTGAAAGLVVTPILHNYLHLGKYPKEFSVTFRQHSEPRRPDGYFHPSTHPMWTERQLYLWLTAPEKFIPEPLGVLGALSVTVGTAMHDFVEVCLIDAGILQQPTGTCVNCKRPHGKKKGQCAEWGAMDEATKSRGHMDGMLFIDGWGHAGFEFKTTNHMKMARIESNDIEGFKAKWPAYYYQVQEYMRITGLQRFVVVFLGMGYPWEMLEFVIPRDEAHIFEVGQKYRNVLAAVASGNMPMPCCAPRSSMARNCPHRMSCPVGLQ